MPTRIASILSARTDSGISAAGAFWSRFAVVSLCMTVIVLPVAWFVDVPGMWGVLWSIPVWYCRFVAACAFLVGFFFAIPAFVVWLFSPMDGPRPGL